MTGVRRQNRLQKHRFQAGCQSEAALVRLDLTFGAA